MYGDVGLKLLNDESIKLLEDLYGLLIKQHGSDSCLSSQRVIMSKVKPMLVR